MLSPIRSSAFISHEEAGEIATPAVSKSLGSPATSRLCGAGIAATMASVPGTTGASTSTHSGPQLKGAEDAGGQTLSRVRARPHQSQPQPQQPSQSQPQQSQPQIQPLPPFPPSAPPASRPNTFYPPLHHGEPIGAAQRASKIGSTPTFSTATVAAGPGAETATGTGTGSGKGVKRTQVFKRTRTGCTTCRRRKLKCDEGKPACARCVKSKAPCEYLDCEHSTTFLPWSQGMCVSLLMT